MTCAYLLVHFFDTGTRFPQAIASFIPLVTGPQAVVCADRAASSSLSWEAAAQLLRPLNSTQTVQVTFWADSVLYARKAAKRRMTAMVSRVLGYI